MVEESPQARGTPTGEELAEQCPELTQGRKRPVLPPAGKAGKQTRSASGTGQKGQYWAKSELQPKHCAASTQESLKANLRKI